MALHSTQPLAGNDDQPIYVKNGTLPDGPFHGTREAVRARKYWFLKFLPDTSAPK